VRSQTYSAEFKQAVVQELLAGEKRASQICRERQIDVTTLRRWRIEHDERGAAAWHKPDPSQATAEQKIADLERVIGQLTVENMVLKKPARPRRGSAGFASLSPRYKRATLPEYPAHLRRLSYPSLQH